MCEMKLVLVHCVIMTVGVMGTRGGPESVCTDPSSLTHVIKGRLVGHGYRNITVVGLMHCAQECLRRSHCRSVNFDPLSMLCELNDVNWSSGALQKNEDTLYSDISHFPQGVALGCANHACARHEVCVANSTSSTGYQCSLDLPTSCADVQRCKEGVTNGEYWIYLVNHEMARARVYCHGMITPDPTEFITLVTPNRGRFPEIQDYGCIGSERELIDSCVGMSGEIVFTKIRLDRELLVVKREDKTFASYTNDRLKYGQAEDCYTEHKADGSAADCGPKGSFTINLTHTGYAVSSSVQWTTFSWRPWMQVQRSHDNQVVELTCGGYPGGCTPDGTLTLMPVADTSGTNTIEVTCNS